MQEGLSLAAAMLLLLLGGSATFAEKAQSGPATIAEHQAACAGRDGWSDPAPPLRIFANVHDVGTCGIVVLLVTGTAGAVLIDGATPAAVPGIIANLRRLGLSPSDVKLILSSHEHLDHAGGLAALRRLTGATMIATAAAKAGLESGVPSPGDPQRTSDRSEFPGVTVDRIIGDKEVLALGSLRLTAHATPGHAPGSTSWSWRSCEGRTCRNIVYADSVTAISGEAYSFSRHPDYVAAFRASLARIASLPCDLIITPHPASSALYERLAGRAPLATSTACASYAHSGAVKLDERLARERMSQERR